MFRPPRLLVPQVVPTAANVPQGSRDFYIRAERASLPRHAPDMLAVRIQAIDGARTSTLQDSQPCRLLPLHLLQPPDILCANDSRQSGDYSTVNIAGWESLDRVRNANSSLLRRSVHRRDLARFLEQELWVDAGVMPADAEP